VVPGVQLSGRAPLSLPRRGRRYPLREQEG
jgi:hypothetical protein